MKKLFAIALSCVYLTLTVGVAKTTHYCMGRLSSTSLFSFEGKYCGCGLAAREGKRACCHDESELVKVKDNHAATSVLVPGDSLSVPILTDLAGRVQAIAIDRHRPAGTLLCKPPPPVPLYALFSAFRFFDVDAARA